MTKLFIGNLPYTVTNQDIENLFANAGQVLSASVIMDKFSGKSKGFAFVEMASDEEAQKAIQDLNETEFEGRKIFVSVARPREDRPQTGGGFRDNRGGGSDRRSGGSSSSGGFRSDRRR